VCEHNWKDLSATHTAKRNRLSKERAEKLVFVKGNRRALKCACLLPANAYNWGGADGGDDDSGGEDVGDEFMWAASSEEEDDDVIEAAIDDMPANVLGGNSALLATDSEAENA
jgi:hypothetical protein